MYSIFPHNFMTMKASNSIKDFSCSNLKYSSLGQSVRNHVPIQQILNVRKLLDLPKRTSNEITLNKTHSCSEELVQKYVMSWLGQKEICGKYWVHDTHVKPIFLGNDLKPDICVSTESLFPYGEVCVSFFIEVKAGDANIKSNEYIGQATAYCIRLLELSAPEARLSASCVVTNLTEAVIVKVKRSENGDWVYQKCILNAELAFYTMFSADSVLHGSIGRTLPITINRYEINLIKYLGSGGTGVVYETHNNYAVKFFIHSESARKFKEKHILDKLNLKKNPSVCLQQVIDSDYDSDTPIIWPALLLTPVGKPIRPLENITFTLECSFFCIFETLRHAHSKGIIHNDIRPENIVRLEQNEWLLIDWAAAWELSEKTCESEKTKQEYYGCVTYASDLVLTQLAACPVQEDGSYEYVIDCPSILTDIISLFRTMYVFTNRISNHELNELMILRGDNKFTDIISWWGNHLSQNAQDVERLLMESYEKNPDGIYDTAIEMAWKLFPKII